MPIKGDAVTKIVIGGEWISVQVGTFRVEKFALTDGQGAPMHPDLGITAFSCVTENGDRYYGRLDAIEILKTADM
jgi:hypothetical protein